MRPLYTCNIGDIIELEGKQFEFLKCDEAYAVLQPLDKSTTGLVYIACFVKVEVVNEKDNKWKLLN